MTRPAGDLRRDLRQHRRDVLVRQAVKAVALHAGVADLARQRHELGDRRLAAMKAGVEAGDLRHVAAGVRHDRLDRREVVRLMQRRERHQRAQVLEHLRRDDRRTREVRRRHGRRDGRRRRRAHRGSGRAASRDESSSAARPSRTECVRALRRPTWRAGAVLGGELRRSCRCLRSARALRAASASLCGRGDRRRTSGSTSRR